MKGINIGYEYAVVDRGINHVVFSDYKPENEGEKLAKDMFLLMIYLIGIETKDLF